MQRRTYYDAEPWYQREKTQDWYQQMTISNEAIKQTLTELVCSSCEITEVACGGGWLAEFITSLDLKSYRGFDFSPTAVANAKKRLTTIENFYCYEGDALSDETYSKNTNLIVAHQFFHCLVGRDRLLWLKICNKILKANSGKLILSSMIGMPESLKAHIDQKTKINAPRNRYYAEDEGIQLELQTAGFRPMKRIYPESYVGIYILEA